MQIAQITEIYFEGNVTYLNFSFHMYCTIATVLIVLMRASSFFIAQNFIISYNASSYI